MAAQPGRASPPAEPPCDVAALFVAERARLGELLAGPAGASESAFAAWLDGLQAEWVHAACRLSPAS